MAKQVTIARPVAMPQGIPATGKGGTGPQLASAGKKHPDRNKTGRY